MNFLVEPAKLEQLNAICEMVRSANAKDVARGYPPQWFSSADDSLAAALDAKTLSVATDAGNLVACFSVQLSDEEVWGESTEAAHYLHCFTVAPEWQLQGIGSQIINHVEALALSSGRSYVRLDVPTVRTETCAWYAKLGYSRLHEVHPVNYRRAATLFEKNLTRLSPPL